MAVTTSLRALVIGLLVLFLVGCGDGGTPDQESDDAPRAGGADVNVTCNGDIAWPASAMTDRTDRAGSADLVPALEDLAGSGGMDAPYAFQGTTVAEADWFVLARDGHAAAVATGPWTADGPGKHAQIIYLDRQDHGWKATGWGDCQLAPMLPAGEQWVEIEKVSGTRDTSDPTLLVHEIACTSGRDPRPFLLQPRVVESDDRVTVSWTSKAVTGAQNCLGTAGFPATLTLAEPLGDRTLYDGSRWPPRVVD